MSSFFEVKKQTPKTNLKNCYYVVLALKLLWTWKFAFPQVIWKTNKEIALHSNNQITITFLYRDGYK